MKTLLLSLLAMPVAAMDISIDNATVVEGDDVVFTISADGDCGGCVAAVNYRTGNVTAIAGQDYMAKNGMINIAAGDRRKVVIETIDDDEIKGTRSFLITLSGEANITKRAGVGHIEDNEFTDCDKP